MNHMKFEHDVIGLTGRPKSRPIASLICELDRAVRMIALLDDINYRRQSNGSGSVGAQFRHNLDFVASFLRGVAIGRVDYSARQRDIRIENDRGAAIAQIQVLKAEVEKLAFRSLSSGLSVRSEIDKELWLPSSVFRELEFVHSHTVHHHALIAEKLFGFGMEVEKDFGVAPSTLQYWKEQAA